MTPTLTDLLLRDPEHPEVRKLLMDRYAQVCKERAMLARLLGLEDESRRERDRAAYDRRRLTRP